MDNMNMNNMSVKEEPGEKAAAQMRREAFKSFDGKELSLCIWDDCAHPKGVIQISHGMAEHIERYDDFAGFLNSNGFIAAGEDHRAHGETDKDALGIVTSENDLFSSTVKDGIEITKYLKRRFELPVILLGHSYGSFLAQDRILQDSSLLSGVILSGSAFMKGLIVDFGRALAGNKVKRGKTKEPGQLFANMTFVSYDKKVKDGKNGWLSRDKAQVEKYNANPYNGFICSNGFYYSFFTGLKNIAEADYSLIDKNLKLFIISGGDDYVGGRGKLVVKLYENYVKNGLKPVLKLYKDARHEILNETNKDEVYKDILDFALSSISG